MAEQGASSPLSPSQLPKPTPDRPAKIGHGFEESGRPGKRPRLQSPLRMTAAAAHAEEVQQKSHVPATSQSPNPQVSALGALMGVPKMPQVQQPVTRHRPPRPILQQR